MALKQGMAGTEFTQHVIIVQSFAKPLGNAVTPPVTGDVIVVCQKYPLEALVTMGNGDIPSSIRGAHAPWAVSRIRARWEGVGLCRPLRIGGEGKA